jgi:hypothetical protein
VANQAHQRLIAAPVSYMSGKNLTRAESAI